MITITLITMPYRLPYYTYISANEVHNLYPSPSIIRKIKSRRMRWADHVARIWPKRNAYRILVGKPEGKRPLENPRCRWVDNIKIYLREIGWGWYGLDRSGSE
jgi:hypothetical protein